MVIFFNEAVKMPWEGKPSIYSYIREQGAQADGSLPDDDDFWSDSPIRWVAGGVDGAFGHHAEASQKPDEVSELLQLLAKHARKQKRSTRKALYNKVVAADIGGIIDSLLDEARSYPGLDPGSIFHEAKWFAEHAAHRNAVKFGIALLGLFHNEEEKELLLTLGGHEEFTLYAAVAIQNGMEQSNEVLFELAKRVHGWGKIHLVERLDPASREIKDWLLRDGCRNTIMNEYLACVCARHGGLHEALSSHHIDTALFEGATDIIDALIDGGPAEDIDDYEHAPQVLADYLRLAKEMCSTVKHLAVMLNIRDFFAQDEERWAARMSAGWTEQLRTDTMEANRAIIEQPEWSGKIMKAVDSSHSIERHYATICAERLGVDIWENLYKQFKENPLSDSTLFHLMKSDDPGRIGKLVQFAAVNLPLWEIASGPGEEMGFGEQYAPHRCLDTILQSLDRFEGMGAELVIAGLNSPVIRNRSMAIDALEGWSADAWGERIVEAVRQLAEIEPDDS